MNCSSTVLRPVLNSFLEGPSLTQQHSFFPHVRHIECQSDMVKQWTQTCKLSETKTLSQTKTVESLSHQPPLSFITPSPSKQRQTGPWQRDCCHLPFWSSTWSDYSARVLPVKHVITSRPWSPPRGSSLIPACAAETLQGPAMSCRVTRLHLHMAFANLKFGTKGECKMTPMYQGTLVTLFATRVPGLTTSNNVRY